MLEPLLLFAVTGKLWHSMPLIVIVSLVYSASRHETAPAILSHAVRLGIYLGAFFAAIFILLMFLQSRL